MSSKRDATSFVSRIQKALGTPLPSSSTKNPLESNSKKGAFDAPMSIIAPSSTSNRAAKPQPQHKSAVVLYDFEAQDKVELSVHANDIVLILDDTSDPDWWKVKTVSKKIPMEGFVPATYLEPKSNPFETANPPMPAKSTSLANPFAKSVPASDVAASKVSAPVLAIPKPEERISPPSLPKKEPSSSAIPKPVETIAPPPLPKKEPSSSAIPKPVETITPPPLPKKEPSSSAIPPPPVPNVSKKDGVLVPPALPKKEISHSEIAKNAVPPSAATAIIPPPLPKKEVSNSDNTAAPPPLPRNVESVSSPPPIPKRDNPSSSVPSKPVENGPPPLPKRTDEAAPVLPNRSEEPVPSLPRRDNLSSNPPILPKRDNSSMENNPPPLLPKRDESAPVLPKREASPPVLPKRDESANQSAPTLPKREEFKPEIPILPKRDVVIPTPAPSVQTAPKTVSDNEGGGEIMRELDKVMNRRRSSAPKQPVPEPEKKEISSKWIMID